MYTKYCLDQESVNLGDRTEYRLKVTGEDYLTLLAHPSF